MVLNTKNLYVTIKQMVDEIIQRNMNGLKIFEVTDVSVRDNNLNITQAKINIKDPNSPIQYDNVPIIGIGLGNLKGTYNYPTEGDFVVVGWLGDQPIVLGSVNDFFSQTPDEVPQIKVNELIIVGKERGQYIFFNAAGDILLRTVTGAKMRLKEDGSFKLFTGNDFGIEADSSGNVTVRSPTVNIADGVDVPVTLTSAGTF